MRFILLFFLLFFVANLSASTQAKWRTVTAGWYHTLAIDHNGDLWSWGSNSSGQLGNPDLSVAQEYNPQKVFIAEKPQVKWQKVFAGPYNSFALDTDGVLWAWGANRYSVLGINQSSTTILTPTKVDSFYQADGNTPIENVVINNLQAASFGTIAISTNGDLFVWGRNNEKQLFDVTELVDEVEVPVTEIKAPRLKDGSANWIDVAAADSSSLGGYFAINNLGEAFFFGENDAGLSGTGINGGIFTDLTEITHPNSTANVKKKWVEIGAGKYKAVAIDEFGYALQWGDNVIAPQTVPFSSGNFKPFDSFITSPEGLSQASESLNGKVQVRTNYQAIANKDNDLYFWGLNQYYTTSSDKFFSGSNDAIRYIEHVEKWNKIHEYAIQERSVIIVNDKRDIFAHGSNSSGQLGLQSAYLLSSSYSKTPQAWTRWSKIVAAGGNGHSLAIMAKDVCFKNDTSLDALSYTFNPANYNSDICPAKETINETFGIGPIWGWGDNTEHQLTSAIIDPGENTAYIDKPSPLTMLDDSYSRKEDWVDIVSANNHVIALDVNGYLYAWGSNSHGQLGLGHANSVLSATKLALPNDLGTKWRAVSTSDTHTLAIDTDGKLWAWGSNSNSQLGYTGTSLVPKQVGVGSEWQQVVAANGYSFALNSSGQRFAWGKNANEELGDSGIVGIFSEPTLIDSGWLMIAASNGYGFGVKNDNKIYFWGAQAKQVTNGETVDVVNVETPELFDDGNAIHTVSSWRQIVSDGNTNLALTSEGQLWAWGNNVNAQTGTGVDSPFEYLPIYVLSDYNYTYIDSSAKHSLGIANYNLLTGWGYNEQSQTGSAKVFGETYALTPKEVFLTDRDGDGAFDHIDLFVDDPRFTVDTDGDGIVDELDGDSDNDGISDDDEREAGLNPFDSSDAALDSDLDGMTNLEELSVYQTCNHVTDSSCSLRESVLGPLNLSYIQNAIYKSALDTSLLNRRYFSFSSGEFTQDYPWASQGQIDSVESFIEDNTSLSPIAAVNDYTRLLDLTDGYDGNHSLQLTNNNKTVAFNSVFKTDEFANPTVRKLIPGTVFFSFKFSDSFEPSQDKLVVALKGMPGTGIIERSEIWASSSQDTKNQWHIAKFDLTSSHLAANESYLNGFAQLSWKMICQTSCDGKTVNIDTLSFPIDINENGIPAEYRKLASNGSATSDSDSDGLSNLAEYQNGTNPLVADTDGDGIPDNWEVLNGTNALIDDANADLDNDSLTNYQEYLAGTNPKSTDSDNDGLPDSWEVSNGTNPLVADANGDSDGDGLSNKYEYDNGLDAGNNDQDNDGIIDGQDNDPLVAADSDGDGWDNAIERSTSALDEQNPNDVWKDVDNDGRPLILEVLESRNINAKDNKILGEQASEVRNVVLQAYVDVISHQYMQAIYYDQNNLGEIDNQIAGITNHTQSLVGLYQDLLMDSNSDLATFKFIGKAYLASLGRQADLVGFDFYRERLSLGQISKLTVVSRLIDSPEFTARFGTELSSEEFVTLVYQNVLGREPDPTGLTTWTNRLNNGAITRAELMLNLIESPEYESKQGDEQLVRGLSLVLRNSGLALTEAATYKDWYKNDANGLTSVLRAYLGSKEYFLRMQNTVSLKQDSDDDERPDYVELLEGTQVSVMDNSPVTDDASFVKQVYRDLASEFWSVDDLAASVTALEQAASRGDWMVSSGVLASDSFINVKQPIARLYLSAFLRTADYAGLNAWQNKYENGMSLEDIANQFTQSGEFTARYGTLNNSDFVNLMYQNIFNRNADSGGYTYWLNRLNNGTSRGVMLISLSESAEGKSRMARKVEVSLYYHYLLERKVTNQELTDGVNALWNNQLNILLNDIVTSSEYGTRF